MAVEITKRRLQPDWPRHANSPRSAGWRMPTGTRAKSPGARLKELMQRRNGPAIRQPPPSGLEGSITSRGSRSFPRPGGRGGRFPASWSTGFSMPRPRVRAGTKPAMALRSKLRGMRQRRLRARVVHVHLRVRSLALEPYAAPRHVLIHRRSPRPEIAAPSPARTHVCHRHRYVRRGPDQIGICQDVPPRNRPLDAR